MHTANEPGLDFLPGDKFFYPTQNGFAQREIGRVRAAKKMLRAVERYRPDLIYLRYGIYVYPVHRLAYTAPVVEEINTNDVEQHKELGVVYSLYNRFTRGILLRSISGLVCVSKELAKLSVFRNFRKPTKVIANGIDLNKFTPLDTPNNSLPRIIFIGEHGHSWHGVDKIVSLARNFSDIRINLIGYEALPENEPLPDNLISHGYLSSEEYLTLFSLADVAISSLALHRVNLTEASPLKSREYLAYGLPTIIAYKDTDLEKVETDYILKIPNTEDNILTHGKLIRDFAYEMRGRRVDHKLIAPHIDNQVKECKRLAFFEEIIQHKTQEGMRNNHKKTLL
jgi:glycosyltransferase involved in cell wall biosynthesis